jgi:hypothetical protein
MEHPGEIVIVAPVTPRIKYIVRFLFSTCLGLRFKLIAPDEEMLESNPMVVNYSTIPLDGAVNIFSSGFLEETGIKPLQPEVFRHEKHFCLFPAPEEFDLSFDIFSAAFYMLSRYEEYLPFTPDPHGRFEADQSLAWKNGFCTEPVVDQWSARLKQLLLERFSGIVIPERKFRYLSTMDVDSPWAFRNRGKLRMLLKKIRIMLNFDRPGLRYMQEVLEGRRPDPFDTFDHLHDIETRYHFRSIYFLLSGNRSRHDVNDAIGTIPFAALVRKLKERGPIGIHPSYRSNRNLGILADEYERFSSILGHRTHISRQHFLILKFPETYQRLIELDIHEDYSMGYASYPGFRAGTSIPFRFYDLSREVETKLMVHPFVIMDVTLLKYMGLKPEKALEKIRMLADKVKEVNGIFVSLWHNDALSETGVWKGWRRVFEEMARIVMSDE